MSSGLSHLGGGQSISLTIAPYPCVDPHCCRIKTAIESILLHLEPRSRTEQKEGLKCSKPGDGRSCHPLADTLAFLSWGVAMHTRVGLKEDGG